MSLTLLPAVDVAGGQAVRLVQGAAGSETSYGDPVEADGLVELRGPHAKERGGQVVIDPEVIRCLLLGAAQQGQGDGDFDLPHLHEPTE